MTNENEKSIAQLIALNDQTTLKAASWKAKAIARREEAEQWKARYKKLEQAPNLWEEKFKNLKNEIKALKKQIETYQRSLTKLKLANDLLKKKAKKEF